MAGRNLLYRWVLDQWARLVEKRSRQPAGGKLHRGAGLNASPRYVVPAGVPRPPDLATRRPNRPRRRVLHQPILGRFCQFVVRMSGHPVDRLAERRTLLSICGSRRPTPRCANEQLDLVRGGLQRQSGASWTGRSAGPQLERHQLPDRRGWLHANCRTCLFVRRAADLFYPAERRQTRRLVPYGRIPRSAPR